MLCKPPKDHVIDYIKLKEITGIVKEEVEKATPIEIAYPKFVDWLLKYNAEGNVWSALIMVGQNADLYDKVIHERMLALYCKGIAKDKVFRTRPIDLMNITNLWFENTHDLPGYGLTALREFFGMPLDKQHRGLVDVQHTGWIVMKMLKLHRELARIYLPKMANSYKKVVNESVSV